jgi:anti-sigma factor RsiW
MIVTCKQAKLWLHAYIDGELDANHVAKVEGHLAACSHCAAQLRQYRHLHRVLTSVAHYQTPEGLRRRIEVAFPTRRQASPSRRTLLQGLAVGAVLSTAARQHHGNGAGSSDRPVINEITTEKRAGENALPRLRSLRARGFFYKSQ